MAHWIPSMLTNFLEHVVTIWCEMELNFQRWKPTPIFSKDNEQLKVTLIPRHDTWTECLSTCSPGITSPNELTISVKLHRSQFRAVCTPACPNNLIPTLLKHGTFLLFHNFHIKIRIFVGITDFQIVDDLWLACLSSTAQLRYNNQNVSGQPVYVCHLKTGTSVGFTTYSDVP